MTSKKILNKEKIFLKFITYAPLFFVPLIIGIISFIINNTYNDSFKENIKKLDQSLYEEEKRNTELRVSTMVDIITYHQSIIKYKLKLRVKERVKTAYNIATEFYNTNKDLHSKKHIKHDIKIALQPLHWNNKESYIWIMDYNGTFVLAPPSLKYLENTSIINTKDAVGRYIVQEEITIAKNLKEGYLWDTFIKPNNQQLKQYKQVAFIKDFGHFDWYFGSHEFLDTARKKSDKQLLNTLKHLYIKTKQYMFIAEDNGHFLINKPIKNNHNQNLRLRQKNIKNIINQLKKNQRRNFISIENQKDRYYFVKKVPHTNWIIGSGFHISDIEAKVIKQKIDMYDILYSKSNQMIFIAFISLIIVLLISYHISQLIKESFFHYRKEIFHTQNELKKLNQTLELKVKTRTHELETLKNKFEKLATIDTLTQINNRYSLMNSLKEEIYHSKKHTQTLSILLIDIDFFKNVNDTYGHDIGDTILKTFATLMKKSIRNIDTVGRYGGEEFIIILPNTLLNDAVDFSERLRLKTEKFTFEKVKTITISIGVIELQKKENILNAFKRVDKLLYKAKEEGRNRVKY